MKECHFEVLSKNNIFLGQIIESDILNQLIGTMVFLYSYFKLTVSKTNFYYEMKVIGWIL